ncbi:MAG: exodeoxyribonuclease VII large subunit [Clostridiales bacterium]|nr:exodeoxyribonuclease VII large subunit [Clostridiales bacterium]
METSNHNIVTVSQIGAYVKRLLESDIHLKNIYVKGEISNFTHHKTGHLYFDLKDAGGVLNAVMFAGSTKKLNFNPENGMMVVACGRLTSYEKGSRYQIIVGSMEPDGVGALYIAFEKLKAKLQQEGLFDPAHKKSIPKIPTRLGVVTSPTGAAIRDIINVSGRRFPFAKLVLYPALVQGEGAAVSVCDGIRYFNQTRSVDVIIIGRGGGSIEDLWAFNDETLARVIYDSEIPIISAVGHEIDFTIADFVADLRAPTPTAAAELALPDTEDLKRRINNITERMRSQLTGRCAVYRQALSHFAESRALSSPQNTIDDKRLVVASFYDHLEKDLKLILSNKRNAFVRSASALEPLNPLAVIKRGYAAVYTDQNMLVQSAKQLTPGQTVHFKLSDGNVLAEVKKVEEQPEGSL